MRFSDHATLEVLNISSGYEAWEISLPGLHVVATGGGKLAVFSDRQQFQEPVKDSCDSVKR